MKLILALISVLALAPGTLQAAETKSLIIRWSALAPLIDGRMVELTLEDGEKIKGKVVRTERDSLTVRRGRKNLPYLRTQIDTIRFEELRGKKRLLGTILGYVSVGGALGEDVQGPLVFVAIGAGAVGYALGRDADRRVTLITTLPD